jgi:hypothetical protein
LIALRCCCDSSFGLWANLNTPRALVRARHSAARASLTGPEYPLSTQGGEAVLRHIQDDIGNAGRSPTRQDH